MDIRRLTDEDAESYRKTRMEALKLEPQAFTESPAEHQAVPVETIRKRLRPDPSSDNFVTGAFHGHQLIGMAGFYRRTEAKTSHRGHIWGVYIDPKHRGQGVGQALLKELLRLARSVPGIEQVSLAVSSDNIPARRLYEALGFEKYGCEARALKIGDGYVDEDLMILYFRP